MNSHHYAVVMAGGRGERFWPLSTSSRPKQVLSLVSAKPMLAMAVDYLDAFIPPERVLIITSADLIDATCAAVPQLPRANVIGEPFGRDTAAVVALASALIGARDPRGVFCMLTADHIIGRRAEFQTVLKEGMTIAADHDVLLTIGIRPTAPSSGFGYIEAGARFAAGDTVEFFKARRFVEKPDAATARRYVADGNFYWNAGMFMWSVEAVQRALDRHAPALRDMARRMQAVADRDTFADTLADAYGKLERISVDYALLERADNIVMARGTFPWDDVGSWEAIARHLERNADGNVAVGNVVALDATDNIVVSHERLTALLGVRDLIVIQAPGATLVCDPARAQDVKTLVTRLRADARYKDLL